MPFKLDLGFCLDSFHPMWSDNSLFTPLSVSPTAWYDPSDLSSVWQDSARTTPGAVGSPVGSLDDKSGGGRHLTQATTANKPILRRGYTATGAEKISNGTFDTNITGWLGAAGSWDAGSGGRLAVTGAFQNVYQTIATTIGQAYKITGYQARGGNTGGLRVGNSIGDTSLMNDIREYIDHDFIATATTTYISCASGGAATATYFDNISVKEATANDQYYLQFDGVDDKLIGANLSAAGTNADIIAGIRTQDSAWILLNQTALANPLIAIAQSATGTAPSSGAGTPVYKVNRVALSANTRDGLHDDVYALGTPKVLTGTAHNISAGTNMGLSDYTSAGFQFTGRFYGMVVAPALAAQDLADVEAYIAGKMGVTL